MRCLKFWRVLYTILPPAFIGAPMVAALLFLGRRKKLKMFQSPVAGRVVDVGGSWPGGAALLRVDLGLGPIGEKKVKIFLSPDRGPTPSGSSTNSLYRAVLSSRSLSHIIRHFLTLGILFE